jgi:hypothetical protein
MKCSEVRTFLSQIDGREEPIAPIPPADLNFLASDGYLLRTTKEDHDKQAGEVAGLSQMIAERDSERAGDKQANEALQQDEQKEHSFLFHLEHKEEVSELSQRIQNETPVVSTEESSLNSIEANVNELIEKKSTVDRMVPCDGEYLSLTDLGIVILNDLNVRNYRVADQEFSDFLAEIKAIYAELRLICDRASSYVILLKPWVTMLGGVEFPNNESVGNSAAQAPSLFWSTAIGLAKLRGDANQIGARFVQALRGLQSLDSAAPDKLLAAEIMTALVGQDVQSLQSVLRSLDRSLRDQGVPKDQSAEAAATIMAGRKFDGSYPLDRFAQFKKPPSSFKAAAPASNEAAAILSVMNVPFDGLISKFQAFRLLFASWGFMSSEDTELASALLAIGELDADEVEQRLRYIVEQLKNYLEYPLVAAAILASIPVFESHEVLDLMEKAVTLLSAYAAGLERSELVALAVRMIHGVRNELVKEIDSTAKTVEAPIQFTYSSQPGFFIWYSRFGGMGGFHPAHSHGIGGFAG